MRVQPAPTFLSDVAVLEAEVRGVWGRLEALSSERVAFDMDELDARVDAAETLGLAEELRQRLAQAVAPLEGQGAELLEVEDAHAGMPSLRRLTPATLRFSHDAATIGTLAASLGKLAGLLEADPDRTVATLAVGLGGTGGCASGECLPEDAPPGPLFERAARV